VEDGIRPLHRRFQIGTIEKVTTNDPHSRRGESGFTGVESPEGSYRVAGDGESVDEMRTDESVPADHN
jgi:hypothetical protein